jgi:hypothetical protein
MNEEEQTDLVADNKAVSRVNWSHLASRIDGIAKDQAAVRTAIDRHVDSSCFDIVDGTACRNKNYAMVVFRLVGGSFEYTKDSRTGAPLVAKEQFTDDDGDYYTYTAYGRYILPDGSYKECSGMFSSRDKLFGKKDGAFRAMSDVNERFVRQAALTECFKKGVLEALGYGDLSVEEAKKAGAKLDTSRGYQHKSGRDGGSTDTAESGDVRANIERICRDMVKSGYEFNKTTYDRPEDYLKAITANPGRNWEGWKSFRNIKDTQLEKIFQQMESLWMIYFKDPWQVAPPAGADGEGEGAGDEGEQQ